jgi:hypothetical protein
MSINGKRSRAAPAWKKNPDAGDHPFQYRNRCCGVGRDGRPYQDAPMTLRRILNNKPDKPAIVDINDDNGIEP